MIEKIRHRYWRWKEWCRYCRWCWFKKFLVLIGLKKSAWFDAFMINPFMTKEYVDESKREN